MKMIKHTLLFGSGFAGGLITGLYVTSSSNSETFLKARRKTELSIARLSEVSQQVLKTGSECLREFNNRLKKEMTHPIPDLYKATESFILDEEDVRLHF